MAKNQFTGQRKLLSPTDLEHINRHIANENVERVERSTANKALALVMLVFAGAAAFLLPTYMNINGYAAIFFLFLAAISGLAARMAD